MATTGDTTINLQHWLDLLHKGDDCARTELLRHAYRRMRIVAKRMLRKFPSLRRWEEPADVHHSALVRLHRSLAYVIPKSLAHFHNLARMQIRRELLDRCKYHARRRVGKQQDVPEQMDKHDEPRSMSEWSEFHRLVDALPEEERIVFKLIWYERRTHAEVAAFLKICVRTVIRRWQAARILIQQGFHGGDNGDANR